jgi:hypothetical protein
MSSLGRDNALRRDAQEDLHATPTSMEDRVTHASCQSQAASDSNRDSARRCDGSFHCRFGSIGSRSARLGPRGGVQSFESPRAKMDAT